MGRRTCPVDNELDERFAVGRTLGCGSVVSGGGEVICDKLRDAIEEALLTTCVRVECVLPYAVTSGSRSHLLFFAGGTEKKRYCAA